jgi:hypothetical protein
MSNGNVEARGFFQQPRIENTGQTDLEKLEQAMEATRAYVDRQYPDEEKLFEVVFNTEQKLEQAIKNRKVRSFSHQLPDDSSLAVVTYWIGQSLTQKGTHVVTPKDKLAPGVNHSYYDETIISGLYLNTWATADPYSISQSWHRAFVGIDTIAPSARAHLPTV